MTNDRAVDILRNTAWLGTHDEREQIEEAVKMAVNALTAQEQLSNNSPELDSDFGDLISRQAAIDALKGLLDSMLETDTIGFYEIENVLFEVPSAQPERETAKFIRWMECKKTAKYISYTPHCKCSKCGTEFLITTIKYCYMCGAKMEENNEAD